jgi:hypothetical protein
MHARLAIVFALAFSFSVAGGVSEATAQEKSSVVKKDAKPKMSAKERDIRKFLKITGSAELAEQTMRQMVDLYRRQMPQVPAKFWDDFLAEAKGADLLDLLVPVYDQNLSHDDIKALIAFHESPAGKRYTAALPKITAESQAAGEKWGMALGQRVLKKLQEEGYQ